MASVFLDDQFDRNARGLKFGDEDFRLLRGDDEVFVAVNEERGRTLFRHVGDR